MIDKIELVHTIRSKYNSSDQLQDKEIVTLNTHIQKMIRMKYNKEVKKN